MDSQPARIVLIDTDLPTTELLRTDLTRMGHSVTVLDQVEPALGALSAAPPDLVLLGLNRPGLNGHDLLPRLKAEPALALVPVIAIGPPESLDTIARAVSLGAEDYLQPPFHPTLVQARIAACLDRRALRAARDENL
jgi:DNA-binding response OmpR family regulator